MSPRTGNKKASRGAVLPNFLIVGAHKCGTTSLYHYLGQHPAIFVSGTKEPEFIALQNEVTLRKGSYDGWRSYHTETLEAYQHLFDGVKNEIAIGEGSVSTLYHYKHCIPTIKEYLGSPRIIIGLRDPVRRAYSAYLHKVRVGDESLSFEEAMRHEDERKGNRWHYAWHYASVSYYFYSVKAYLEAFDDVFIFLYEDLRDDGPGLMRRAFEFLGVDASFSPDLSIRYNVSGVPRHPALKGVFSNTEFRRISTAFVKRLLPSAVWSKFRNSLSSTLLTRPELRDQTKTLLRSRFREDILMLQELIGRDLAPWL